VKSDQTPLLDVHQATIYNHFHLESEAFTAFGLVRH
jgi:hypothetical protein